MTDEIKDNRSESEQKIAKGEYDVFLSYNHKDQECVKEIGKWLKDNGIAPYLDEWDLQPGLPWQPALEQQIKTIKSAAIFIGQAGVSRWHRRELDAFLDEFTNRECPVIPTLLPDAPPDTEIPTFLKGMTWVDFRKKDPDPLERLIWGITSEHPAKVYRPGILIACLGDSPVIVSSMYDLLKEKEKLTIDRVTVLCPKDDEVQHAYKLAKEALIDMCELRYESLDFNDADSELNARVFLHRLYHLLYDYQKQDETVYLSLAGGRKSMAALMAWVVPFFPCVKKLYHVIDKEEKNFPSVYEINAHSSLKRSQLMHPDLSQLSLVEIPSERGQQISEKLLSQLLSSQPDDYEKAEALLTGQAILQGDSIIQLNVTKLVIDQFHALCKQNKTNMRIMRNGLMEMSKITTLRDHEIGSDTYSFKSAKFPRVSLHYFTGLQAPIRPVFYTLPADIYTSSDDQVEQVVICSLETAGANGYRTLKEIATSPDFSVRHQSSIDALPPVPSPAESVLIVPLGKSPMVATQLYTLLTEQEKHTIHEVVLIYPQRAIEIDNAAQLIEEALSREYNVSCRLVGIRDLEDITDEDACREYQSCLEGEIDRVRQEHPDYKIDLALSGGRKGMTAMTIFAAQKKHIPYVYHTLITNEGLSERIDEETKVEDLKDIHLSLQERYDRLFLRAYKAEDPYPYAHFVLFRVPVFAADGW